MFRRESTHSPRLFPWALALSLLIHGGVLLLSRQPPLPESGPPSRLEATLGRRAAAPPVQIPRAPAEEASPAAPSKPAKAPSKAPPSRHLLAVEKPGGSASTARRQWSVAERTEMNQFMSELAGQAQSRPSLAQRSLAVAEEMGRREAIQDLAENVTLERIPGSPPVERFSLEMYLDGLLKKMNRSAAFVKNDPRARGVRSASLQIRLNSNGSLKSFDVVNAGDQADEIAFVRSVVQQAVPFAPFPDDMRRSAQSLALTICILPSGTGSGFGFSRNPSGRGC
ncbi:MAG TPA: hypothetical protein VFF03_04785 [Rhodocyclaceae bacterium]|nr:hypothetical protein [Rhodocyclaceae bacterium]